MPLFLKTLVLWGSVFILLFLGSPSLFAADYKVVGYYTNWAQYRASRSKEGQPINCSYFPEDIDASLLTHVNFAFAKFNSSYQVEPYEWNDIIEEDWALGMYERLNALKDSNPHLKTLLAIGGWSFRSELFSQMAATKESRATFITSAMTFARTHEFDGIDLDWEFPGHTGQGGTPADKKNFTLLLDEFREAIESEILLPGQEKLLLTMAAPAGPSNYQNLELDKIHPYLDWINLMTYDLHGSWDGVTGHHTAFQGNFSVQNAVSAYLAAGIPPQKIVLGLATYGRSFTLASSQSGVGAPATGGGNAGFCTLEAGFLSNYEIDDLILQGASVTWDPIAQAPYASLGNQWVGFDNEESLTIKLDYLIQKNLGGAMFWALDLDSFAAQLDFLGLGLNPAISFVSERLLGLEIVEDPLPPNEEEESTDPPPSEEPPAEDPPVQEEPPAEEPPAETEPPPDEGSDTEEPCNVDCDSSIASLDIDVTQVSSWGSGSEFSVILVNTHDQSLDTISIRMLVSPHVVSSLWNMKQTDEGSDFVDLTLPDWKTNLLPGESYTFGFILSQTETPEIIDLTVEPSNPVEEEPEIIDEPEPDPEPVDSGEPEPTGEGEGNLIQVLSSEIKIVIREDTSWGTGATYMAELINTGERTLKGIEFEVHEGDNFSPWAINVTSKSSSNTRMISPNWVELTPGQSYTFGWTATFPNEHPHIPIFHLLTTAP